MTLQAFFPKQVLLGIANAAVPLIASSSGAMSLLFFYMQSSNRAKSSSVVLILNINPYNPQQRHMVDVLLSLFSVRCVPSTTLSAKETNVRRGSPSQSPLPHWIVKGSVTSCPAVTRIRRNHGTQPRGVVVAHPVKPLLRRQHPTSEPQSMSQLLHFPSNSLLVCLGE